MKMGKAGLDLLRGFEYLELIAYPDPGSKDGKPWTIGWGHTRGVKEGDTCTKEQADVWLEEDVEAAADTVNRLVKTKLKQHQFDALVCFVYNIGEPQFLTSTMLRMLKLGDLAGAATQFKRWNKNDGKVMRGLTRRRLAEEHLFLGTLLKAA